MQHFVRSVTVLAGGAALGQGLAIAATPVLTRLYTPEDFGLLAVYTGILAVWIAVSSLEYELAIPLPRADDVAANLVALSLLGVVGISLLFGVGVWLLGGRVADWTSAPGLRPYLWLAPFSLLGAGVTQVLHAWAVRKRTFGPVGWTRVCQSGGQVAAQLLLGWSQAGAVGLLLGDLAGRSAGAAALWRTFWSDPGRRSLSCKALAAAARAYARFPLIMSWAVLLNMVELQVPLVMIPRYFGAAAAGMYFLAHRVLILPASLIGGAVAQAFLGEAAHLRHRPDQLHRASRRLCIALLAMNLPVYGGLALLAPFLFPAIFGPQWAAAGQLARILAPMLLIQAVASPLSSLIVVGERLVESLLFSGLPLVTRVTAIMLGARFGSLTAAAGLLSAFGIVLLTLSLWRFLRVAGVSMGQLGLPALRILALNLPWLLAGGGLMLRGQPLWSALAFALLAPVAFAGAVKLVREDGPA